MTDSTSPLTGAPEPQPGARFSPAYIAFFECFNAGRFFEAHEVLEALWLPERGRADARFYQGLIQLAGAFVHFQKDRRGPGVALLRLGRKNLAAYPANHRGLNLGLVRERVTGWLAGAESGRQNPLAGGAPRLEPPALRAASPPSA